MFTEQEKLIDDVKRKSREPEGKGRNSDASFSGGLSRSSDYTQEMNGEKSLVAKGTTDSRQIANSKRG